MKNYSILLIVSISILFGCNTNEGVIEKNSEFDHPSSIPIQVEQGQRIFICDSTLNVRDIQLSELKDSIRKVNISNIVFNKCELIIFENDSLKDALFMARFRLERIKYHVGICNRKPSQNQFLRGWINRDLE